jgi:acyl dehydratase
MTLTVTGLRQIRALAGHNIGHSDWLTVTQKRVDTFADATDDRQWIHVDPQRAKDGPFGGTIAHGYLTLSLLIPLFNEMLKVGGVSMSLNYGLDKVRFPTPVRVGQRIRLSGSVDTVTDVAGPGVQMVMDFRVDIEGEDKPACVARAVYRHYA